MVSTPHSSLRQKLAINSERNVQNLKAENWMRPPIPKRFSRPPSNCIEAAPVIAEMDLVQKIQATMRTAAEQKSAANAALHRAIFEIEIMSKHGNTATK